jgi:cytochrome c peroxidase
VEPPQDVIETISAYLKALEPVPSPYLVNGKLSAAAERGKLVFEEAGCAACHTPPLYTNLKSYNVGTINGLDKGKAVDTPTLVEIWRTAPYLHTGAAVTIEEVITKFNPHGQHGHVNKLTPQQLADLVEFVLSQ